MIMKNIYIFKSINITNSGIFNILLYVSCDFASSSLSGKGSTIIKSQKIIYLLFVDKYVILKSYTEKDIIPLMYPPPLFC